MFIAYTLGFILIAPLALYLYFTQTPTLQFSLIIGAVIIVLWPLIFRYSRILWLHADQLMDPRQRRGMIRSEGERAGWQGHG